MKITLGIGQKLVAIIKRTFERLLNFRLLAFLYMAKIRTTYISSRRRLFVRFGVRAKIEYLFHDFVDSHSVGDDFMGIDSLF